jgi:hypothetical protein
MAESLLVRKGGGGAKIEELLQEYTVEAGENVSAGTFVEFLSKIEASNNTSLAAYDYFFYKSILLNSNTVLCIVRRFVSNNNVFAVAFTFDSNNNITVGNQVQISTVPADDIILVKLTDTRALYGGDSVTRLIDVTGTTITLPGSPVNILSSRDNYAVAIDSTRVLLVQGFTIGTITISGTSITKSSMVNIDSGLSNMQPISLEIVNPSAATKRWILVSINSGNGNLFVHTGTTNTVNYIVSINTSSVSKLTLGLSFSSNSWTQMLTRLNDNRVVFSGFYTGSNPRLHMFFLIEWVTDGNIRLISTASLINSDNLAHGISRIDDNNFIFAGNYAPKNFNYTVGYFEIIDNSLVFKGQSVIFHAASYETGYFNPIHIGNNKSLILFINEQNQPPRNLSVFFATRKETVKTTSKTFIGLSAETKTAGQIAKVYTNEE